MTPSIDFRRLRDGFATGSPEHQPDIMVLSLTTHRACRILRSTRSRPC